MEKRNGWSILRTYSLRCIDTFIPDVYKHSAMPGDMTISLRLQAGVVLLCKFRIQPHATDLPAVS
jgi:hypothetical protein